MMNNTTKFSRGLVVAMVLALALGGCGTLKKFTGQRDDSILPGERENILSPEQQTAKDPVIEGGSQADTTKQTDVPCDTSQPDCISPIDQEGSGIENQ